MKRSNLRKFIEKNVTISAFLTENKIDQEAFIAEVEADAKEFYEEKKAKGFNPILSVFAVFVGASLKLSSLFNKKSENKRFVDADSTYRQENGLRFMISPRKVNSERDALKTACLFHTLTAPRVKIV